MPQAIVLPSPLDQPVKADMPTLVMKQNFPLRGSTQDFEQIDAEENRIHIDFQVKNSSGQFVNGLQAFDFTLRQNNQEIRDVSFEQNVDEIVQTVDIAFLIDVTGSMQPTIDSVKQHVIDFIRTSRERGYRTRMCLSTFGDYTVSHCSRFYDNNPRDPSTQQQVTELISEVSKLRALKYPDPGGFDLNENPMRALIDASRAPWGETSLRFAIVITDDGFLYSPGNQGAVGNLAPRYTEVLSAIRASQMKVFAVTPTLPGYNQPFQVSWNSRQPGVVQASGGEHFEFRDVVNNRITFTSILNRILRQVRSTYRLSFIADEENGLQPQLPLAERRLEVQLTKQNGWTVEIVKTGSTQPQGRPEFLKNFKLTDKPIRENSLKVFVNNVPLTSGFKLERSTLIFNLAPVRRAKIRVQYEYQKLEDALSFSPIFLDPLFNPNYLRVYLNDIEASTEHLLFGTLPDGKWSLQFTDKVITENDPFQIRLRQGLQVSIVEDKNKK
jgi:hypothetical protein